MALQISTAGLGSALHFHFDLEFEIENSGLSSKSAIVRVTVLIEVASCCGLSEMRDMRYCNSHMACWWIHSRSNQNLEHVLMFAASHRRESSYLRGRGRWERVCTEMEGRRRGRWGLCMLSIASQKRMMPPLSTYSLTIFSISLSWVRNFPCICMANFRLQAERI